jgi:RNA polymerase-binding transcription factor DksA
MSKTSKKTTSKVSKPVAKKAATKISSKDIPVSTSPQGSYTLDEKRLQKAAKGPFGRYVKLLLDLRDRLLDGIEFHASDNLKRTQRDASSDLSAYSFHMADAGTDNFDREFALSMVSNEQEALYEINEALKRLENGAFGTCEMCEKPIPRPRLDAIPWARYTVDCQSELERTHQKRAPQTFQPSDFGNSEDEVEEKDEED